jgi:drug/metabolite transporter (DMT)-like permease
VNLLGWLSEMEYPHWMMVAGAALVVLGFIGFAFRQNKNGATVDERAHEAEPKEKGE